MTTIYKFKAYYKTDGVGAVQDPAPVCTVINMADDAKLADAQATSASVNMPGLYTYSYSGADGLDCVAFFHTTDADADEADIGSYTPFILYDLADVDEVLVPLAAVQEDLDNPNQYKADVSSLMLAGSYVAPDNTGIADIKAKTDNLPASPAPADEYDADFTQVVELLYSIMGGEGWTDETLVKIVADIAAIVAGSGATAQEVWEYATRVLTAGTNLSVPTAREIWANPERTLTNAGVSVTSPATGDPLEIYKDATVVISLTGLGDISGLDQAGDKLYFTAKENLDDADSSAIIQIYILAPGAGTPGADTLTYINGAAATAGDGIITIVDKVTGAINVTLYPAAADDLPIYAATPLYWDVKTYDADGAVIILQTGTMYIYGTATKSIT
jgi:hypothetical protein